MPPAHLSRSGTGGSPTAGSIPRQPPAPTEQSGDCHSQSTHPSLATLHQGSPDALQHPTQRGKVRWLALWSPNSLGKWFYWQLLRIRKIMPSRIFRWSALLRPLALGGSKSNITGSIRSQRSSGTSQIVGNAFPSTTSYLHPSLGRAIAKSFPIAKCLAIAWPPSRLSREGGNPEARLTSNVSYQQYPWIPAFAGKTMPGRMNH